MTQADWNTLAIMCTVAMTAGGSMLWLSSQFRRLEQLLYSELGKHQQRDDQEFERINTKLQRIEIKTFGFRPHPNEQ